MASFSVGEALGAGFGLVRRHPLSVVLWGVVYTVLMLAPLALMIPLIGPDFLALMEQTAGGGTGLADSENLAALNLKAQLIQPVSIVCSLLASGMLNAAIFRAVLRPQDKGFFFLRIGKDEFWQAIIALAVGILFLAAFFAIALIAVMLGAALWFGLESAGGGALHVITFGVPGIAAWVSLVWVGLRFSLAAPATFATGSFQLFESWSLTRGQDGRLFGLAILMILVFFGLYLVFILILGIAAAATGLGLALNREAVEAFFEQDPLAIVAAIAPFMALVWGLSAVVSGAFYAILIAPWASVYRQLTVGQADAAGV